MQNKIQTLISTTLLTSLIAGPVHAGNDTSVIDYARVTRVEPIYRTVTVREPQRHCEYITPSRSHRTNHNSRHHHNRSNNHRRENRQFVSGESYIKSKDAGSAAIIGGVIGGVIGHHLNQSINGRQNPAVTLAGAAIGSSLAHSAARDSGRVNNNRQTNTRVSHNEHQHQDRNNRHQRHDRNNHNRGYERCVTTTVSRQERRQDGYNVTYVYRGNTFQTRTDQHPGDQIRVRVQIRPH